MNFPKRFSAFYAPDQGENFLKAAYEMHYFGTSESRLKK